MSSLESSSSVDDEPLAVFLRALLAENRSIVQVVHDNCWGLSAEDAESFLPLPGQRMSDSSMPELRRWESQCQTYDGRERTSSLASSNASPLLPKRRSSHDDIFGEDDSTSDESESEEGDRNSPMASIEEHDEPEDITLPRNTGARLAPSCQFVKSERKKEVPPASSSANNHRPRHRRHGVSYTSTASADPLANLMSHTGRHRLLQNPVQVLERIDREVSRREQQQQDAEWSRRHDQPSMPQRKPTRRTQDTTAPNKSRRDSLPCSAKRRPSPLLEKALSAVDLAPARAKRRPSPDFEQCLVEAIISQSILSEKSQ